VWKKLPRAPKAAASIDRPEVPNITLHLLSMPSLEISESVRLPLDTGLGFYPLEKCRDIVAVHTGPGDRSYHRLGEDPVRLRPLRRGVPGRCRVGTTRLQVDRVKDSLRVVRGQRALDLPYPDVLLPGWSNYRVTNGGRSSVMVMRHAGLHAIRDLDRPKIEPIRGVWTNSMSKLAGDPASDRVFIATWQNDDGEYPYRRSLSRVSPNAGTGIEHLTDLGPRAPDYLEYLPGLRLVVYRGSGTGPVLLIDGDSGEVRMEISDVRANAPMSVVAGRLLADDRVVDLERGEFVGVLPGLKAVSRRVLLHSRYLAYTARSDGQTGAGLNRVLVFDLTTSKVTASTVVPHVDPQIAFDSASGDPENARMPHIVRLFETKSGKLGVLSGDFVRYPVHRGRH
jgi:hypothetical protein